MGRGRGKGKKQSAVGARNYTASGEDEKLLVGKRGRPQKPLKDDLEEVAEVVEIEENDYAEETKSSVLSKGAKNQAAAGNDRKRKRPSLAKENADSVVDEENGMETKTKATDLIQAVGYRQNGSRRKNKPRRAAEVGVECK